MRVTAETKQATRQAILETAQKLFSQQGFEAATTRDIARAAGIGIGTLFNYFSTKEAIAHCLISEAYELAVQKIDLKFRGGEAESLTFEEELFAHIAAALRKLKPFRKYLTAVLDAELSPLAAGQNGDLVTFRTAHLETVGQIATRHGQHELLSTVALQLYWTLYLGVLAFWSQDASPRQEDTLALLDQSLAMFVGWLATHANPAEPQKEGG